MFETISRPRERLGFLAQAISLALTALIVWRLASSKSRFPPFLQPVIADALESAVLAWLCAFLIGVALYASLPGDERGSLAGSALRTSTVAVWFAPSIVLLSRSSPGSILPGLVLVVTASRLLYSEWRRGDSGPPGTGEPGVSGLFANALQPATQNYRDLAPAWGAAAAAQACVCAILMRGMWVAAVMLVATAAVLTVQALARGVWQPGPPRKMPGSVFAIPATIFLAALFTIGGLAPYVMRQAKGGAGSGNGDGLFREAPEAGNPPGESPWPGAPGVPNEPAGLGGDYLGVVLRPEVEPVVTLIAPVVPGAVSSIRSSPLGMPFWGEYWYYRDPFERPPWRSFRKKGSPAELSFSTTDGAPLRMEARQRLLQPLTLRCCSAIDLEILNGDRFPGTISLTLGVSNSEKPRSPVQWLGSAPVVSAPKGDPPVPLAERLRFRVAPEAASSRFDEIRIVFVRDYTRQDKSARIAIERIILIPRGAL